MQWEHSNKQQLQSQHGNSIQYQARIKEKMTFIEFVKLNVVGQTNCAYSMHTFELKKHSNKRT